MKKSDVDQILDTIIENLGGVENITKMWNCLTRLRFQVIDKSKVREEGFDGLEGVIQTQWKQDQFQVVVGTVAEAYRDRISERYGLGIKEHQEDLRNQGAQSQDESKKPKKLRDIPVALITFLSDCITPSLTCIVGGGLIKGLLILFSYFELISNESDIYFLLNTIADVPFYFLPFLIAHTASKKLEINTSWGITIAGVLLHGNFLAEAGTTRYIFSFAPVPMVKYTASVIPILLSLVIFKYIYKAIQKVLPKALGTIIGPALFLSIGGLVSLVITAPIGYYISMAFSAAVNWGFQIAPAITGAIYGAVRQFVVLTGMHMSLTTIIYANMDQIGYDILMPIHGVSALSVAGACFGACFLLKKKQNRGQSFSAGVSAVMGITEPGLYAVMVRFKKPFIASCIGSAIGGAFVTIFGGKCYTVATPSLISIGIFEDTMGVVLIGMGIAFVVSLVCTIFLKLDENVEKSERAAQAEKKSILQPKLSQEDSALQEQILAPMDGEIIALSKVKDETFSSGVLGEGVGLVPIGNKLVSPVDGVVTFIAKDSLHGVGFSTKSGRECLLHMGIDTVELGGKHFQLNLTEGQSVQAGEVLGSMDVSAVIGDGYDPTVTLLFTNKNQYQKLDVKQYGQVTAGEAIITVE